MPRFQSAVPLLNPPKWAICVYLKLQAVTFYTLQLEHVVSMRAAVGMAIVLSELARWLAGVPVASNTEYAFYTR